MDVKEAISILNRENWRGVHWKSDAKNLITDGLFQHFSPREAVYLAQGIENDRLTAEREASIARASAEITAGTVNSCPKRLIPC